MILPERNKVAAAAGRTGGDAVRGLHRQLDDGVGDEQRLAAAVEQRRLGVQPRDRELRGREDLLLEVRRPRRVGVVRAQGALREDAVELHTATSVNSGTLCKAAWCKFAVRRVRMHTDNEQGPGMLLSLGMHSQTYSLFTKEWTEEDRHQNRISSKSTATRKTYHYNRKPNHLFMALAGCERAPQRYRSHLPYDAAPYGAHKHSGCTEPHSTGQKQSSQAKHGQPHHTETQLQAS